MPSTPNGRHTVRDLIKQSDLPKLPVPQLEDTLRRYLRALEGLQTEREHKASELAVHEFLHGEGPRIHEKLIEYSKEQDR